MKTLVLSVTASAFVYLVVAISSSLFIDYLAFSKLVYIPLVMIFATGIYFMLKLYRERSCFIFNKIASIMIVLTFSIISTTSLLKNTHDVESVFKHKILSLNKQLPMMVDADTRFDRVYFNGDDICYEYTLTKVKAKSANKDFLTLALADRVYHQDQLDRLMLTLSKRKRAINYIYHDKNKNFLTKVELKLN